MVPLAGDRSAMLGLHLLSPTAPEEPRFFCFCKPASCSWRAHKETCCWKNAESFSDEREIQNLLRKQKTKLYESKTQTHVRGKGSLFQLGSGRTANSLTAGDRVGGHEGHHRAGEGGGLERAWPMPTGSRRPALANGPRTGG